MCFHGFPFLVVVGAVFLAGLLIGLVFMIITYRLLAKSRGFVRLSKHDEFSSQTPIYMKASSPKCDIVSVWINVLDTVQHIDLCLPSFLPHSFRACVQFSCYFGNRSIFYKLTFLFRRKFCFFAFWRLERKVCIVDHLIVVESLMLFACKLFFKVAQFKILIDLTENLKTSLIN